LLKDEQEKAQRLKEMEILEEKSEQLMPIFKYNNNILDYFYSLRFIFI